MGRHSGLGAVDVGLVTERCQASVSLLGCDFAPVLRRSHGGAPPSNHFGTGKSEFGTRKSERDAFLQHNTRGPSVFPTVCTAITLTLGYRLGFRAVIARTPAWRPELSAS